ncbi:hypothetical protein CAPTEDRAFT_137782 [Capitella teleta]|uniref:Cytochrome P450 n=1 Tax=Capitella teleta TaxID=283909 RepID=R7VHS8_CAPTE|nr:hypothetical protein CAPTEDRAFT_137782 [Capitella teleta]|eukprot:ELU18403.1 hypothetical protein CAPTEDRAFT_137782 [Capitella teleta]
MLQIVLAIGLIGICIYWITSKRRSGEAVPRYRGLPFIGNLHQLNLQRPELTFTDWSKDLGAVFSVKFLSDEFVVLNTNAAIREALVTKRDTFAGRPQGAFRTGMITDGFQDITFCDPNPRWRFLRRTCQRSIKLSSDDSGNREMLGDMIAKMVNAFLEQKTSFNPRETIYRTTVGIIIKLLVNERCTADEDLVKAVVDYEKHVLSATMPTGKGFELDLFPWMRYFGIKSYKYMQYVVHLRDILWDELKKAELRGGTDAEDQGLVAALLRAQDEMNTANDVHLKLSDVHVKQAAIDMVVAGTGTTTLHMYAYFNIISNHPDIQDRLFREVDLIVGKHGTVSVNDRKVLPICFATTLELLRYANIGAIGLPHATLEATTIAGKKIAKGAQVLTNLWAVHHDEDFWEEPFEFRPDRFLDSVGRLIPASHPNRQRMLAFGAGARVCIGEFLATTRLFLVIASTAQKCQISPGDLRSSYDPRHYGHGMMLNPPDYEIKVKGRY